MWFDPGRQVPEPWGHAKVVHGACRIDGPPLFELNHGASPEKCGIHRNDTSRSRDAGRVLFVPGRIGLWPAISVRAPRDVADHRQLPVAISDWPGLVKADARDVDLPKCSPPLCSGEFADHWWKPRCGKPGRQFRQSRHLVAALVDVARLASVPRSRIVS
jgi:hypothetical protein